MREGIEEQVGAPPLGTPTPPCCGARLWPIQCPLPSHVCLGEEAWPPTQKWYRKDCLLVGMALQPNGTPLLPHI